MIYQTLKKRTTLIWGLLFTCVYTSFPQSKNWSIGIGNAITSYDFTTSGGNKIDYLKNGTGNSYVLGFEQSFLDTNKYIGQSSPKAIYYLQHKTLSKFLSKMNFGIKAVMNQYNAVGDIQNLAFDYQTNYAGLQLSVGPRIGLGKKWNVHLNGLVSGQHILQGNQHVNYSYFDLTKDPSFKGLKLFLGYEVRLEKQINNSLSFYIAGTNTKTYQAKESGMASLNFNSTSLLIGIKILGI